MGERSKSSNSSGSDLPPGFRFHPTDEELIIYYLKNQATSRPCPVSIIPEINIYKFDPWELPEKTEFGENEWYFFSPRDRKYPNGVRPNRATGSGYWKATGTDKAIHSGCNYVGVKKALVFYKGRPPKGLKTDWIMHEYRLCDSSRKQTIKLDGSMRLDDWVLCRIYKKRHMRSYMEQKEDSCTEKTTISSGAADGDCTGDEQQMMLPRTFSLGHLLEIVDYSSISHLLGDDSFKSTMEFQTGKSNGDNDANNFVKFQSEKRGYHQLAKNSIQLQVNQSTLLNQQIFVNPAVLEFQ